MSLSEFELIRHYFQPDRGASEKARTDIVLGIGDDCALIKPPAGKVQAMSIDTLVVGVHFLESATPYQIGYRSLAVSLSDLAAMGAAPSCFTLALTLPEADESWLAEFSAGLFELADAHGIALVGGDTTRGPLTISIQVQGYVEEEQAIRRNGAKPGDDIYVSGTLGDAIGGLKLIQQGHPVDRQHPLIKAFYFPEPRIALGQALVGMATAAIDISDGLLADVGHIATMSGVGVRIALSGIPLSAELVSAFGKEAALEMALSGGDDYQLCFCAPPSARDTLVTLAQSQNCSLTRIGAVVEDTGVTLIDDSGEPVAFELKGYSHF